MSAGQRRHHRCGAFGCGYWIERFYFCCHQHSRLLGFDLAVRVQTAWQEKHWDRPRFEAARLEAFRAWGIKLPAGFEEKTGS